MKETTKEMILRKLTSRKFWLSLASFVTMIMLACGATEASTTQVTSIIMAGATVLAYVLAEGFTDYANTDSGTAIPGGIIYGMHDGEELRAKRDVPLDGQEFGLSGTDIGGEKMFADNKDIEIDDVFDLAGTDVGPDEIKLDGQEFNLAGTDVK